MSDRFDLEGHLIFQHHFSEHEIHDLSEIECFDLHRDEHAAGYRAHHHAVLDEGLA